MITSSADSNADVMNRAVIRWLITGCFLIFLMVIIGGITRLTHSGLSMVDWNMIMGSLPPTSEAEWSTLFDRYKMFPEYQQVNSHFSLEEFKSIYWWEYIHRFLGRLIGVVFLLPFFYFLIRGMRGFLVKRLLFLLFLGGLQGFFGWYMVKSGLVKDPDVSHYRLALHLITAFLTCGYALWIALDLFYKTDQSNKPVKSKLSGWVTVFFAMVIVQVIYGAFVAGLNAGFVYNSFPMMGDSWVAEGVTAMKPLYLNFIEGIAGVQFIHRYIAWGLVLLLLTIWWRSRKISLTHTQLLALKFLGIVLGIQFLLGVFTLLYAVPVAMGVLHQAGAFILFTGSVFTMHRFRKAEVSY